MSDPFEGGGISVTIKADEPGSKYNDPKSPQPWIVFHGTPPKVKAQIIEVFEFGEEAAAQPLYALVNEANKLFKAVTAVGGQLGGSVISTGPSSTPTPPAAAPAAEQGGDVWSQVNEAKAQQDGPPWKEEEKPEADPILTALEQAKSVADVQQIWAENQSAFNSNPEYMSAYKARGKALSAA